MGQTHQAQLCASQLRLRDGRTHAKGAGVTRGARLRGCKAQLPFPPPARPQPSMQPTRDFPLQAEGDGPRATRSRPGSCRSPPLPLLHSQPGSSRGQEQALLWAGLLEVLAHL